MPRKRPRVTSKQMDMICEQIAEGNSLRKICISDELPSWRTVLRHIQESDEAYAQYSKARAIQAEVLREDIIDLVEAPLPEDPKLAQAEVQRRRLEADQKDKFIRQVQPRGLRDKAEDKAEMSGTITLRWGDAEAS